MFYREAGQFKTTYAADMAIFPIRQDRYRPRADPPRRLRRHSRVRRPVPPQHDDDPVPDPVARGDRAQPADRLYRPAVARHGRLHGRRRLCLLQARDLFPAGQHPRLDRRERLRLRARRRHLRPAEPAHQGLLSRGRDAGGAVLPAMVLRARALALQLQRFRRDRGPERRRCSASPSPARPRRRRRAISSS